MKTAESNGKHKTFVVDIKHVPNQLDNFHSDLITPDSLK